MDKQQLKALAAELKKSGEENFTTGALMGAIAMLLEGEGKRGFFLTVCDLDDPTNADKRSTAFWGDTDMLSTAIGFEMIDDDDVRFVLNNARVTLDQFNEGLPEEEKLK